MSKNICLMNKDVKVLTFNFDDAVYNIDSKKYLPYQLRGRIQEMPKLKENLSRYEATQYIIKSQKNYNAIVSYLASRVLSLSRENAKKIYNLFGYQQLQDDISKAKIAILCRAISLQDNYWVKLENDNIKWKDVNLRANSLSQTVAMVSLHGSSLTLQGEARTPEMNGQGAYAKAWIRENNELYLLKKGQKGNDSIENESKIEVEVSNILDKCNVPHVKYEAAKSQNDYVCKCKCMTTEQLSILPGLDFISYYNNNNLDAEKEIMKIDPDNIYKMWIVDYLISNGDRHGMNWGFYYDADSMDILGCHPLYDHNNAFDKDIMANPDIPYLYNKKMSMKEAAVYAMNKVDFHFIKKIVPSDFLSKEHYESFVNRARELNIKYKKDLQYPDPEMVQKISTSQYVDKNDDVLLDDNEPVIKHQNIFKKIKEKIIPQDKNDNFER